MITSRDLAIVGLPSGATLESVDIRPDGSPVAIIRTRADAPALLVDGNQLAVTDESLSRVGAELIFPSVRAVGEDRFIIIGGSSGPGANAWILDLSGREVKALHTQGIEDVVANEDFIVMTFDDEGVFRGDPIAEQGLAVFDTAGDFICGHHDSFGSDVFVSHCYAACWYDRDVLAFFPYMNSQSFFGISVPIPKPCTQRRGWFWVVMH